MQRFNRCHVARARRDVREYKPVRRLTPSRPNNEYAMVSRRGRRRAIGRPRRSTACPNAGISRHSAANNPFCASKLFVGLECGAVLCSRPDESATATAATSTTTFVTAASIPTAAAAAAATTEAVTTCAAASAAAPESAAAAAATTTPESAAAAAAAATTVTAISSTRPAAAAAARRAASLLWQARPTRRHGSYVQA